MKHGKKKLVTISRKVNQNKRLTPTDIDYLLSYTRVDKDNGLIRISKALALPLSLLLGFLFTVYPEYFERLTKSLPSWTNLNPKFLSGADYLWDFLGEPIKKANLVYHIPNIVLYSFGVVGIKKLLDAVNHRSWLEQVLSAKKTLQAQVTKGLLNLQMKKGHSLLFVGNGDFIGAQFALNHNPDETVTVSENKPSYTSLWNHYDVDTLYQDLEQVILRSSGENLGEYVFFPVKDDQIFLPGSKDYDLSPHKLDILVQDIRTIEKEHKWKTRRIIIIGDKLHKSFVQSEDQHGVIKKSGDTISLETISAKYKNVTLIDPTDVVLREIIRIAYGRKIVFRATKEGIAEYKKRFYDRLKTLGYKQLKKQKGILTIGYDLFEDMTEQQTLSRKIDDYYPVVLSKNVRDALIRNGYKKEDFLYVPDLVLKTLTRVANQQ
ncbi:MAG TPA: hypothetical protein VNA13_03005 [Xanthomonadales bacterium]|nr:hypothetical protein [Xanthomonadales bacterium]